MKRILIFSTEPTDDEGRINSVKFSVTHGLSHGFINPLTVYMEHSQFRFCKSHVQQPNDKRIGSIVFGQIQNYSQINYLSDPKLINAMILLNHGTPGLPNTIFFDCHFPVSDIPLKDIEKFRIVQVS